MLHSALAVCRAFAPVRVNASPACGRVMRKGRSPCGRMALRVAAVATIPQPQNGQQAAVTSGASVVAAPHLPHLTASVS